VGGRLVAREITAKMRALVRGDDPGPGLDLSLIPAGSIAWEPLTA